jgi:hypothetical protein
MTVVALSVAFVTSRPRVSPLPIPAAERAPARGPGTEAPSGGPASEAVDPDAETPFAAAPDSVDGDSTSRTGTLGDPGEESERSLDLLDLPVWARAKAIQPPPPPRQRTPATGAPAREDARPVERAPRHIVPVRTIVTTTNLDSSGGAAEDAPGTESETAPDPAATARDFASATQRSLHAARAMTAPAFEAAATAWEGLLPRLAGEPEREATAWREAAQARFQAWYVGPTPARRDAAIHAVRAYLLYAPPGPDRDQAWTWLGRLKRAAGTATR